MTFNLPIFSPLCGYTVGESVATNANYDTPLYTPYDAWSEAWWDNLVSELIQARVTNVSLSTRGAYTLSSGDFAGPGSMNPRRLYMFVDALKRAGVDSQFKISCFLDAPSAEEIYTRVYGLPGGTLEDMADNSPGVTNHWQEIWWLRVIKPWFDTIPQSMWFMENGHPRIELWGFGLKLTNTEGNCSAMTNYISNQMQATYGVTPVFVGGSGSGAPDSTWATNPLVIGNNPWFYPPNTPFQSTNKNGYICGTVVDGFIDPNFFNPASSNYQNFNRVIKRNKVDGSGANGDTLRGAIESAIAANCHFITYEGWTDVGESAGGYRCYYSPRNSWDYPNQYINILRPYIDLRTTTLRLEAEACDDFYDTTLGDSGGAYRRSGDDLDVRALTGTPAVTASSELSGTYVAANGMDHSFLTKWITNIALPQWLQYDYGNGRSAAVNTYYVTSADNAPERDPMDWTLQASNNGTTWVTLDTRTGQAFAARSQTNTYTISNTTSYRYYRLNITAAPGGPTDRLQVGDFSLKAPVTNGGGWVVTNTAAGEWIDFEGVGVSSGNYKFPIRYSSTASHTVRLTIDNVALPDVVLPATGSMNTFDTAYLGTKALGHGTHTFKVTFVDGGVDVDWIFVKKYDPMVSFKSLLTNCYLTAEMGGNSTFSSNRTAAANWEGFSVDSLTGGNGTLSDGTVANIQSYVGYYMTAELSGGGALTVNRRQPRGWEQFTLVKVSGSAGSGIVSGDQVALKSQDGTHYVTVVNGTTVNVSGTSIGSAQTFTVGLSNQ
ncbi:MAG TPA: DUF5010 domain-containing protein [Rariglobus sp.]|nr:DUF5010 domain-containing protein [Rariglobus sp.]